MMFNRTTLSQRIVPVIVGAGLALVTMTRVASAAGYGDDDPGQVACAAVACADGSRQCAQVSGIGLYDIGWSSFPYFIQMYIPFSKTCYEKPAE